MSKKLLEDPAVAALVEKATEKGFAAGKKEALTMAKDGIRKAYDLLGSFAEDAKEGGNPDGKKRLLAARNDVNKVLREAIA